MARDRIKFTGYINTSDLEPEDLDPDHPMGITDDAYAALVLGENNAPLTLQDLSDVEVARA